MPFRSLAVVALALAAPLLLGAQQSASPAAVSDTACLARAGADSAAVRRCGASRPPLVPGPSIRPRLTTDRLVLSRPTPLAPMGSMRMDREPAVRVAAQQADSLRREALRRAEEAFRFGANERLGWAPLPPVPSAPVDVTATAPADQPAEPATPRSGAAVAAGRAGDIFGEYADLGLVLNSRLETKVDKSKNERCTNNELLNPVYNCSGSLQPQFDFQFNVRTGGIVADRIHVNVDYDSQREFDASNNINVYYEGKSDELIERLEVGNVFFSPTASRFITGGIPSGNYGLQAKGQLGPMRFSTIVAQQKGNRVSGRTFDVGGDGTLQTVTTDLEDFRFEQRRFFWVVDPANFGAVYPNLDILNAEQLRAARASLPAQRRPAQVRVYRWRADAPTLNARAPKFELRDAPVGVPSEAGVPYELLTPGQDYYIDPSQLWFALVRPVSNNERVVLAYVPETGAPDPDVTGTPDIEIAAPGVRQTALLVYSSEARATDPVFRKEIRAVYRIGGEDLRRETVTLRVGTQAGGFQEVPTGGVAQTYLQMLGLAQASNSGVFDVENRLWPRPGDPVQAVNGGGRSLFADRYLVMPSATPFARVERGGRIEAPNAANDTVYTTESVILNTVARPAARYFMRATFQAQGGGEVGSLMLGSVQVSRNSERLSIDGVPLRKDVDYEVDYDLGRVTFLRPDTLFRSRRQVMVQYEENPLFAAAPTSVFGIASQLPFQNGQLNFIAISQNQRTTFNRPPLGFEPASSLVAGVSGNFAFDAAPLSRFLERIPTIGAVGASTITVGGEIATSRPQPNAAGVAYVESFEGEGGVPLPLSEGAWYYSSRPSPFQKPQYRQSLTSGTGTLDTAQAATLAWQNTGIATRFANGGDFSFERFTIDSIDPQVNLIGRGQITPEQVMWLSLYPANVGGIYNTADYQWRFSGQQGLPGRRWRSIRTVLSPTGADLSRTEYLEFWALVDPSASDGRGKNPVLVFDLGDISENSIAFVPESLTVASATADFATRRYRGRQASRIGGTTPDSERDTLTNQFDASRNDRGLPSDVADRIVVTSGGATRDTTNFEICRLVIQDAFFIGDSRANCTVGNSRLDEEDINLDRSLYDGAETIFRWVIDLNDRSLWTRSGGLYEGSRDKADGTTHEPVMMQWQLIRVPITLAHETIGDPVLRRIRAMRMTVIAGSATAEDEFTQTAIARLRFVGSPWLKRGQGGVLTALTGEEARGGFQIAGIIGTQDSTARLPYTPPPGVVDAPESRQTGLENSTIQINERSIRILAGGIAGAAPGGVQQGEGIPLNHRAEAYFRFPEGQKNFMGYRELRVWARGHGRGWATTPLDSGELQFFVKIGRDPNNFYLFRRNAYAGPTRAAWADVAVKFQQLYRLRSAVQNDFIQGRRPPRPGSSAYACDERSLAMLGVSDTASMSSLRETAYWACVEADSGTYMLFTQAPNTSAPNLAQVQELAVGMTRVRVGSDIVASDTLEVWADDIRLSGVVDDAGYAGELSIGMNAGDVGRFALALTRRDANFRQLGEAPSYITDGSFALSTSFQLERLIPGGQGWSLPVTYSTGRAGQDPYFLAQQDVLGGAIAGLRTPQSTSSRYGVSIRRSMPTNLPYIGALVDNLSLDANLNTAQGRDNYTKRGTKQYDVNASYAVQAQARSWAMPGFVTGAIDRLPGWMRGSEAFRSLRQARFRWNPSAVRFSSNLGRSDTRTTNFIKPAASIEDSARLVTALAHVWRNTAGLELRPFGALTATWNLNSLRDLRHYERDSILGTDTHIGVIAARDRERLLGVDLGLERERQMNAGIAFQPVISTWLRPRAELASSFSYLRDPNTRQLVDVVVGGDTLRRLPRRLNNSQLFSTGLALDIGRALLGANNSTARLSRWRRILSDAIEPVDASYSRTFSSAFDGTPFTPGIDYQLGLGGFDGFLEQRGQRASSAGFNNSAQLRGALTLPLGLTLVQDVRRSFDRTYYRVSNDRQLFRENVTLVLPRLTLGWNYRPTLKLVSRVVSNISANAGWEPSETRGFAPGIGGDSAQAERTLTESRALPVRASITWAFLGDLTTTATYRQQESEEQRPGARVLGDGTDLGMQVSRGFRLPKKWNLSDQVMTSLSWQQSATRRYLPTSTGGVAANQASNGRTAINFNADTQLAENLLGSLVMSRVVNYDNVTSRRFSQFVMTAVFQLTFQAGQIR